MNTSIPRLRDVMQHDVVTLAPDTPALEALRLLARRSLSSAPLLQRGRVVGIVTIDGLRGLEAHRGRDEPPPCVSMAPTGTVHALPPDADLLQAAAYMVRTSAPDLLVMDQGTLIGRVTSGEIAAVLQEIADTQPHAPAPVPRWLSDARTA